MKTNELRLIVCCLYSALFISSFQTAEAVTRYDFDEGSLQGWSQVSFPAASQTEYPFQATTATLGGRILADTGEHKVMLYDGNDRRSTPHATGLLRSPAFQLGDNALVRFRLLGGSGIMDASPVNIAGISADALESSGGHAGYAGVALRRVSDGAYLLYGHRDGDGQSNFTSSGSPGWQTISWDYDTINAVTAGDAAGESYTLDFIDNIYNEWGWVALDSVEVFENDAPFVFQYESQAGQMLDFDGSSGSELVGDWSVGALPESALTAEAWVNVPGSAEVAFLSLGGTGGDRFWIGHDGSGVFFEYTLAGEASQRVFKNFQGHALARNEWRHIAVTWTATEHRIRIYVNGELYHDKIVEEFSFNYAGDVALRIGSRDGLDRWLNATIDEVRVWNRALSQQEIRDNRHVLLNGDENGLIGLYGLDGITGANVVADASAEGRNLNAIGIDQNDFDPSTALIPNIDSAYHELIRRVQWDDSRELSPGIWYKTHDFDDLWGMRQNLFVLEIDPELADVDFKINHEPDGAPYRTTSSVAQEQGAVVAVNGSYWHTGAFINDTTPPYDEATTTGIAVYHRVDGEDVARTYEYHAMPNERFGIPAGSVETVDQDYGDDGAFVFNGDSTLWDIIPRPLPHQSDGVNFTSGWEGFDAWDNVMSSGPLLLQDGEVVFEVDNVYRMWAATPWNYQMQNYPFTAVGVKANGNIILVCGDGRQVWRGLSQPEIAQVLLALDCVDGLRLDGGGSTTMYLQGEGVVNSPSDGSERSVPSHLLVIPKNVVLPETPDTISIDGPVQTGDQFEPFAAVESGSIFFSASMLREGNSWSALGLRPAGGASTDSGGVDLGRNTGNSGFAVFDYMDHRGSDSTAARKAPAPDDYAIGTGSYRIVGEMDFDSMIIRAWFWDGARGSLVFDQPLIEEAFSEGFATNETYYLRLGGTATWTDIKVEKAATEAGREIAFYKVLENELGIEVAEFQTGQDSYDGALHRIIFSTAADSNFTGSTVAVDESTTDYGESTGESQLLFRFDDIVGAEPGKVPSGAFVESATLYTQTTNPTSGPVSIYQVLADWDATTVSWNSFGGGVDPDDTEARAIADDTKINIGSSDLLAWDVTASLRNYAAGDANYGWAFISESGDGWDLTTELSASIEARPKLQVIYSATFPDLYNLAVSEIGSFTATVNWSTRIASDTTVNYGTAPDNLTETTSISESVTEHSVVLEGLLPETIYYFEVVSDDGGSFSATESGSFTSGEAPPDGSGVDKLRVVWADDPATTATIAWNQIAGSDATVHWGPVDLGANVDGYPNTGTVARSTSYKGMENRFVRLSGLTPDTAYYFVLKGEGGTSPRYWFKTASDQPEPFSFIAGGDSRNNQTPRRNGNLMVSKLRPLFVFFTGDMTDGDSNAEWAEWFDDWQLTIADDGRVFPVVPVRGNHENSNQVVYNLFDLTNPDNYYALSFGGDLARLYSLNSEMPAGGAQRDWLEADLQANAADHTWLLSGYHKPMRPHTSGKSEGSDEYDNWAQLFFDHGMDLVADSDSHVMKRTYPIRPDISGDEGFVRDDENGTVYIGEGCWGAPLRSANDAKSWTRATAAFNGFDWIFVYPDRLEARTVRIDNAESVAAVSDAAPFALPEGIDIWAPSGDAVVQVPFVAPIPPTFLIESGDEWKYLDDGSDQGTAWKEVAFDDSTWSVGTTQMGYGDGDESTVLSYGPNSDDKHITTYFRKAFRVYQPFEVASAQLEVLRDDGVVVYLNGTEIARDNMPAGPINSETFSSEIIAGSAEDQFIPFFIAADQFNHGHNVLAVEIHNRDGFSSDMSFDLKLNVSSEGPIYELTYDGYRQVTFDDGDSNQGADDDHDGDLFSNIHEFFFGTNAKDSASSRPAPARVAMEGEKIAFSFIRRKDTGADWTYLFSNDLVGWGELTEGTDFIKKIDSVEASDVETVILEFPNAQDRLFLQIVVTP